MGINLYNVSLDTVFELGSVMLWGTLASDMCLKTPEFFGFHLLTCNALTVFSF